MTSTSTNDVMASSDSTSNDDPASSNSSSNEDGTEDANNDCTNNLLGGRIAALALDAKALEKLCEDVFPPGWTEYPGQDEVSAEKQRLKYRNASTAMIQATTMSLLSVQQSGQAAHLVGMVIGEEAPAKLLVSFVLHKGPFSAATEAVHLHLLNEKKKLQAVLMANCPSAAWYGGFSELTTSGVCQAMCQVTVHTPVTYAWHTPGGVGTVGSRRRACLHGCWSPPQLFLALHAQVGLHFKTPYAAPATECKATTWRSMRSSLPLARCAQAILMALPIFLSGSANVWRRQSRESLGRRRPRGHPGCFLWGMVSH